MHNNASEMRMLMQHPGLSHERHETPSASGAFGVGRKNAEIMLLKVVRRGIDVAADTITLAVTALVKLLASL